MIAPHCASTALAASRDLRNRAEVTFLRDDARRSAVAASGPTDRRPHSRGRNDWLSTCTNDTSPLRRISSIEFNPSSPSPIYTVSALRHLIVSRATPSRNARTRFSNSSGMWSPARGMGRDALASVLFAPWIGNRRCSKYSAISSPSRAMCSERFSMNASPEFESPIVGQISGPPTHHSYPLRRYSKLRKCPPASASTPLHSARRAIAKANSSRRSFA